MLSSTGTLLWFGSSNADSLPQLEYITVRPNTWV